MSAQAVSQVATVDWNIVAGAVATFFVTILIAWTGRQQGKRKVEAEEKRESVPSFMTGVTLQDNYSLLMAAEATRSLTEAIKENTRSHDRNHEQLIELRIEMERLCRKLSP